MKLCLSLWIQPNYNIDSRVPVYDSGTYELRKKLSLKRFYKRSQAAALFWP
jgi:hypothetical protein